MTKVNEHLKAGNWAIAKHAIIRMRERNISLPEIESILRNGFNNAKKDSKTDNGIWKYAIDGTTIDNKNIRVCILFEGDMFVVTVVDLDL